MRGRLDDYLSVATRAGASAAAVYAKALDWKGATFARQRRQRALTAAADAGSLVADLEDASRKLATLVNAVPADAAGRADWKKQLQDLTDRKEDLERKLAAKSPAFRRDPLAPAALAKLLPADAALVDVFEYDHRAAPADGKGPDVVTRRVTAFVVRPGRDVVRVDLGSADEIDRLVDSWRAAISRRPRAGGDDPPNELRRRVWLPLAETFGDAKTVLVSPDGALARLPLAALPGEKPNTYLIEDVAVAVVPVPQMLPDLLADRAAGAVPSLLLVGDVDFDATGKAAPDASAGTAWAARGRPVSADALGLLAGGAAARGGLRGGSHAAWSRLPGTRDEVKNLRAAFAKHFAGGTAVTLEGADATEAGLRAAAPKATWLHLATHGFFSPPTSRSVLASGDAAFGAGGIGGFHPGLLSGLVLAGANAPPKAGGDDGILTALEVSALDLSRVELAVLSACETGLGKAAGGEGVLGLQRAFQAAGAKSVVTSLWQVPDVPTQKLMERFYDNLWAKKLSRLEALRRAQIWMLRDGATDPGVDAGRSAKTTTCRRLATTAGCRPTTGPRSCSAATGADGFRPPRPVRVLTFGTHPLSPETTMRLARLKLAPAALLICGLLAVPVRAEPEPERKNLEVPKDAVVVESDGSKPPEIDPALVDEAFSRYVDPEFLAKAVKALDPAGLADAAIQTAEGERVLGRKNRATNAEKIADLAIKAATAKADKDTLKRLAGRLKAAGKADLADKAAGAIDLVSTVRGDADEKELGVDKLPDDDRVAFRDFLADLRRAKLTGNKAALEGFDTSLVTYKGVLTDKQIAYLKKAVADAIKAAPEALDEETATLLKLGSATRSTAAVYNWCALNEGEKIMSGECAELAGAALVSTGYKIYEGGNPRPDDYVWGKLIRKVTPGHNVQGDVDLGDILQFRDAKYGDGSTTSSAPHHTAVVRGAQLSGSLVSTFEQNSGGKKYVTEGKVNLKGLTAGTIWIYRPIKGTNLVPFEITNRTRATHTVYVAGKPHTISSGRSQTVFVSDCAGTAKWSMMYNPPSSGNIDIAFNVGGTLHAYRMYDLRDTAKGPQTLVERGWIQGFYYPSK